MKNISLVINAFLAIAVIVLYFLHFSSAPANDKRDESVPSKNLKMAYINSDSVLKYYDYFKVSRERLETKGRQMDQDLKTRATSLQGEFESYQRNASTLTMGQARAIEEDLTKSVRTFNFIRRICPSKCLWIRNE